MVGNGRNLSTHRRIEICNFIAMMLNIADPPTPRQFSITRSIMLVSYSNSAVFVWGFAYDGIHHHSHPKITIDH